MKNLINGLFFAGSVMVLIGVTTFITRWFMSPYLYIVGAAMVLIALFYSPIHSDSKVIRRLRAQQVLGGFCLFASSVLMKVMHGNEWMVALAIACVFLLYSAFRLSSELKKEENK